MSEITMMPMPRGNWAMICLCGATEHSVSPRLAVASYGGAS